MPLNNAPRPTNKHRSNLIRKPLDMLPWFRSESSTPIGIDLGHRSIKLVQLDAARNRIIEAVRWDLNLDNGAADEQTDAAWIEGLQQARQSRCFRGNDAVVCLNAPELIVQNIRVPKVSEAQLEQAVFEEAASRLPYPIDEAEIRFVPAADIRQGDEFKREVILLACHRPVLNHFLDIVIEGGLRPVAVDVAPAALVRGYMHGFRREADQDMSLMIAEIGATSTLVVITRDHETKFTKYIDVGGHRMDEAIARHMKMSTEDAAALRRHNGDRRSAEQDPDVIRTIVEATRVTIDRLAQELSMCARYHSVTFRGQRIARLVIGGGEASEWLCEALSSRVDFPCEVGEPLRKFGGIEPPGRQSQWGIATGLALRSAKVPHSKSNVAVTA